MHSSHKNLRKLLKTEQINLKNYPNYAKLCMMYKIAGTDQIKEWKIELITFDQAALCSRPRPRR